MATDTIIEQSALILVSLPSDVSQPVNVKTSTLHTPGRTLAINWLPVTDSAMSTIMGLRPLYVDYEAIVRTPRTINNGQSYIPRSRLAHPFDNLV